MKQCKKNSSTFLRSADTWILMPEYSSYRYKVGSRLLHDAIPNRWQIYSRDIQIDFQEQFRLRLVMEPLSITTSSPTMLMGTTTSNESTTVLSSSSATLDCHTRIVSFSPLADLITKSGPPSTGLNSSIPPWKERVCLKRYKVSSTVVSTLL